MSHFPCPYAAACRQFCLCISETESVGSLSHCMPPTVPARSCSQRPSNCNVTETRWVLGSLHPSARPQQGLTCRHLITSSLPVLYTSTSSAPTDSSSDDSRTEHAHSDDVLRFGRAHSNRQQGRWRGQCPSSGSPTLHCFQFWRHGKIEGGCHSVERTAAGP